MKSSEIPTAAVFTRKVFIPVKTFRELRSEVRRPINHDKGFVAAGLNFNASRGGFECATEDYKISAKHTLAVYCKHPAQTNAV